MNYLRIFCSVVLLAALSFRAMDCEAFEAWNFSSGASKADLEQSLRSRGESMSQTGETTTVLRQDPASGQALVFLLHFCNDRLASISKEESFTPSHFIELQYALIRQYGNPTLSVQEKSVKTGMGNFLWREIDYTWETSNDKIQIAANTSIDAPFQINPGLSVMHSDDAVCVGH